MSGEAGPLRMIFTLGIAGLLSGGTVVGAYEVTLPTIERNHAEALEKAIYKVLPGATQKKAWVVQDGKLVPYRGKGLPKGQDAVYAGLDKDGHFVGFAIPAEGPGFQDTIGLIYGVDPKARKILGLQVLQSVETPGLGAKIMSEPTFAAGFAGVSVDPEVHAVKKGTDRGPNDVDAITGATISSKSVVRIVNRADTKWLDKLPKDGGGQ